MIRRPVLVFLTGMAVRDLLLPLLVRLADWMDPGDTAPSAWEDRPPLPDERMYVPRAWVEMEAGR